MNHLLILSLMLNVISSVGVILINKRLVFIGAGFNFGIALTIIHFLVSFLGCLGFAWAGFFRIKKLNVTGVISISLAFCGYVVFNNLSLLTNSVSVYQTSKIVCTPVILAIEYVYYGKREETRTLISLAPVCIGVAITVMTDTSLNFVGSVWAVLAIISNALYTIWGKTKQDELKATPLQLLTFQAPISTIFLCLALPMDNMSNLAAYQFTPFAVAVIALSCIFAFGVNFSFFLFVGQTSPLTMNVVGYFKTVLVFVGGFILFPSTVTLKTFVGVLVTLVGLAMYTNVKMQMATAANTVNAKDDNTESIKQHRGSELESSLEVQIQTPSKHHLASK